ncbi:OmpA family protein [Gaetbulibacter sp. NE]|uniref:OmpA family protein n=1 Tax=Gaetbulibacter sp. NE TaxID=2982307 RepID=UPI0021CF1F90|nr:OmpA family protein [Gaetbulibacter sp. NE]
MKYKLLTFSLLFQTILFSQNLVKNPSFELRKRDKCFVFLGDFDSQTLNWSKPNNGSTDSFLTCSSNLGTKNYNGQQSPKEGNTYCGIYTFSPYSNYREYIQGELKEPLIAGKTYKVKFYVSLADMATHAIKELQVLFTEEKIKSCFDKNSCEKVIVPKRATTQRFMLHTLKNEGFLEERSTWEELSFEFVASGFENFLSIGNFNKDGKTELKEILTVSRKDNKFSYYYIDEVSVEATEKSTEEKMTSHTNNTTKEPFKSNTTYVFKNVLFDFDKATLLETSKAELNALYDYLKEHPDLHIEVYGHTDAVGTETRNDELSKLRAEAVSNFLVEKGLESHKVKWFGFGSSKPKVSNDTEANRAINRRVEFKLIKK